MKGGKRLKTKTINIILDIEFWINPFFIQNLEFIIQN